MLQMSTSLKSTCRRDYLSKAVTNAVWNYIF